MKTIIVTDIYTAGINANANVKVNDVNSKFTSVLIAEKYKSLK